MTDIVQRLLDLHTCQDAFSCDWSFLPEAAAEITRLTEALRAAEEREKALREASCMAVAELMRASGRLEAIAGCNEDRRMAAALSGTVDFIRSALAGAKT